MPEVKWSGKQSQKWGIDEIVLIWIKVHDESFLDASSLCFAITRLKKPSRQFTMENLSVIARRPKTDLASLEMDFPGN